VALTCVLHGYYGAAVFIGLLLPWLLIGRAIRVAFYQHGIIAGFGYWLAPSALTIPLTLLAFWVARLMID
jgi:hypothetical protein